MEGEFVVGAAHEDDDALSGGVGVENADGSQFRVVSGGLHLKLVNGAELDAVEDPVVLPALLHDRYGDGLRRRENGELRSVSERLAVFRSDINLNYATTAEVKWYKRSRAGIGSRSGARRRG